MHGAVFWSEAVVSVAQPGRARWIGTPTVPCWGLFCEGDGPIEIAGLLGSVPWFGGVAAGLVCGAEPCGLALAAKLPFGRLAIAPEFPGQGLIQPYPLGEQAA